MVLDIPARRILLDRILDPTANGWGPILNKDYVAAEEIAKAGVDYRAALERRGITDLGRVPSILNKAGTDAMFGHLIAGLVAHADLTDCRVLRLVGTGYPDRPRRSHIDSCPLSCSTRHRDKLRTTILSAASTTQIEKLPQGHVLTGIVLHDRSPCGIDMARPVVRPWFTLEEQPPQSHYVLQAVQCNQHSLCSDPSGLTRVAHQNFRFVPAIPSVFHAGVFLV